MELGPLPVHGNLAGNGELLFHSGRNAQVRAVLENHIRRRASTGRKARSHRQVLADSARLLRGVRFHVGGGIRDLGMNGQRALADILRRYFSHLDAPFHVLSKRNQRPALVYRFRYAGLIDGHCGHGRHRENSEKVRLGMIGRRRKRVARWTFRVFINPLPPRKLTRRRMVSHVQSVPFLTAFPLGHGHRLSRHLCRNEETEALVLVRCGIPRLDVRSVLFPLDHQGS